MPFRHLPNEVLLIIARHLEPSMRDLNSFWQTSRHLNLLLGPLVLKYISQHANPLLLWAARHGRPALAKTVLAHGGDLAHTDPAGWTLLHIAAARGHDAVVRFLLDEGISADALGAHGKCALERAAHFGHAGVVRILIKRGLCANAMDWDGQTPLHYAAAGGQDSVVSVLIEGGAEIDIQGPVQGNTPLQWAAMRGRNSTALLLLDTGADIAVRDLGGRTVLHYAARSGDEDVVRLVLDRGADVDINVCNDSGETAFHTAVFEMSSTWAEKWKGVLKLLVNRGVDASKQDNGGSTGLDIAMDGGCPWSSELAQYSQTDTRDTQGFEGGWY